MTYYRLALQEHQSSTWIWKSTPLFSLDAVLRVLRTYSSVPPTRLRVFRASSKEGLHEMLDQENNGQISDSVTAAQFLRERRLSTHEQAQRVVEQDTAQASRPIAVAVSPSSLEYSLVTRPRGENGRSSLDKKRLEIELGTGGDHDTPYRFSLPSTTPQFLTWMRLQARIEAGELQEA